MAAASWLHASVGLGPASTAASAPPPSSPAPPPPLELEHAPHAASASAVAASIALPATRNIASDLHVFVDAHRVQEAALAALVDREPRLGRHGLAVHAHDRVLERAGAPVVGARAL